MSSLKALYQDGDMRQNLYAIDTLGLDQPFTQIVKDQAQSVACMMHKKFLKSLPQGSAELFTSTPKLSDSQGVAHDVAFREEPTPGSGTAFLVDEDLMLTAAHCLCLRNSNQLDSLKIKSMRIVFNFAMEQQNQCKRRFSSDEVYKIKRVIAHIFCRINANTWADWALIKLNKKVQGRTPLQLGFTEQMTDQLALYMLGHPSGLPLKFTYNAEIKKSNHPGYVEANIDAFAGNSGSPVLSRSTSQVIGILVVGNLDYEGAAGQRHEHHVTLQESARFGYEQCQRVGVLSIVEHYIKASHGDPIAQYAIAQFYAQKHHHKKALSWMQKSANQGHASAQAELAALSHEIERPIALHPPSYRQLSQGLNLAGVCKNFSCISFLQGEEVYLQKGFNTFNIPLERRNFQCPACAKQVHQITSLIFWNCSYSIDGHQSQPQAQTITHNGRADLNRYKNYNLLHHNVKWIYLNSSAIAIT